MGGEGRLRRIFRWPTGDRRQVERDVDEELQFHMTERTHDLRAAGTPTGEAVRQTHAEFGDVERARTRMTHDGVRHLRRERLGQWHAELAADVRYAIRQLRRAPGFTAVAALTLALGIGATTAIFSAVDGVLLRPLPYADPQRTVALLQRDEMTIDVDGAAAPGNFLDWRDRSRTVERMAAAVPFGFDIVGQGVTPQTVQAWAVTPGFFDVLAVRPLLGRTFAPEEFVPYDASAVVVLSHGFWQRHFGGDPHVVGRALDLNGRPHTVVGVLPPSFRYPVDRDLWAPLAVEAEAAQRERGTGYIHVVGRLAPGVTAGAAQAELDGISAQLAREYPRTNATTTAAVVPVVDHVVSAVRPGLLALLGAVACILLIACANVANLLLARGGARRHELAVRGALGASRGRLARQLLTESALLALLGGAAGLLLAYGGLRALLAAVPVALPASDPIGLDVRVLGFAAALTMATALLFGLVPALRFSRADVRGGLRGTARDGRGDPSGRRLRALLVAGEIALSVVLLVGAGLLGRSLASVLRVELGFETENRLALQLFVWDQVDTRAGRIAFFEQLGERVHALPGIRAAGATSALPFLADRIDIDSPVTVTGRPPPAAEEAQNAYATIVTPGYFPTLGIALRRGRLLRPADRDGAPHVVVVNEAFARRFFPGEDPVGRRFTATLTGRALEREIVGVVADVRQAQIETEARPEFYVPHAQSGFGSMTFVALAECPPAAGGCDAAAMRAAIERELWTLAPDLPVYAVATMEGLLDTAVAGRRFTVLLTGGLAALALLLAAVGIYGVTSVATRERTHEFGVRLALGARARDILALTLGEGVRLAVAGVVVGALGAGALAALARSRLYGVTAGDPLTYAVVAATLVSVALVACWLPARRAARVEPTVVLRGE